MKHFFTLAVLLLLTVNSGLAQVGINYNGEAPASHTILDVKSDTTGMLIPRMTTTQRNALAAKLDSSHEGMVVYDKTEDVLYFWNGSEFEKIASGILSRINDADNDTWVETETGTDSDDINIGNNGVRYWRFKDGRLEFLNTGNSVLLGYNAGNNDDFSSNQNIFIGYNAGYSLSSGYGNVAIGVNSLFNSNSPYNVAVGHSALYNITSGANNIGLGYRADYYNQTGNNNVIIGYKAGFVGSTHSKSGNVFIGNMAGYNETGSNKLYIDNSSTSTPLIYGDFSSNELGFMGNVGIGTKTPEKNLHVVGSDTLGSILISPNESTSGDDAELLFGEDIDYTYGMSIKYDGGANKMFFYGKSGSSTFGPLLTIERSGNVGIGTDDPSEAFEVVTTGDVRTAYFTGEGEGISDATLYSENTNSTSGIAGFFQTEGADATIVLKQNGTGSFMKAFGPNGGNEEWKVDNDGRMTFYNSDHNKTIVIDPSEVGTNDAGQITLYNAAGTDAVIEIDGNYNGDGRITTNELQITGGSDLSEFFELSGYSEIKKGMVVSIDENNPGHLKICTEAYDKKVAGVVSGANNIKPGLIMSQKGTVADGEHLIALSGRVYCLVDATERPVEIGDMLTTSTVPGYAMKVDDYQKAQGAIIGKAMTSLKKGKGLVLVLVTLQ